MNIQELYNKFVNGDSLTTEELKKLSDFMENMALHLKQLGPRFHLSWLECLGVFQKCEDYIAARARA